MEQDKTSFFHRLFGGVNIPTLVAPVRMPIILAWCLLPSRWRHSRLCPGPPPPPSPPTKMTVLSLARSNGFLLRSRCPACPVAPSFVDGDGDTVSTREPRDLRDRTPVQSHANMAPNKMYATRYKARLKGCVNTAGKARQKW